MSGAAAAGRVCVDCGATHALIRVHDGAVASDEFGDAVAGAGGDFNGDGIGDFVAGDPAYSSYNTRTGWNQVGRSTMWFGGPAGWENDGAGWAGKNGIPSFVSLDDPQPGYLVTLQLGNSPGATTPGLDLHCGYDLP